MNIICKNMSAGYGKTEILKDINLEINPGEKVFIGGANGSDKTTLLRVLAGIIPHAGEVLIDGKEVSSMKRKNIAKLIALMPQTNEIYFPYTVNETVLLGTYASIGNSLFGSNAKAAQFAVKCMEDCCVLEFKDRHLDELSGGQLQRVLLARTFAQGSPFLFLDEPGNNLDIKYRAELCDKLNTWSAGKTGDIDNTLVAVFHDLEQAKRCCTRAVMLKDGCIVFDGDITDAMKPEMLMNIYDFDVASYVNGYSS
ncbi:iron complex transport system ATP-binding protein [Ruminococcaceae bacterium R-25]|nr:iron complex transport system ATP-binding protein [Ruminococcaceae bacterium R-25]SUQ10729.1 iron complex transport system ATP-binding protein [Oscillospiraceae bacterium]